MQSVRVDKPSHVPDELVFALDPLAVSPEDEPNAIWKDIQVTAPPIFWTPFGGHWVLTRAKDIRAAQVDHEHFSHSAFATKLGAVRPLSLDPPYQAPFRKLIMPAFAPSAILHLEERARVIARELTADIAPRGECEFMSEFADILPMEIFLEMVGLPSSDRMILIEWVAEAIHGSDPETQPASLAKLVAYIESALDERRRKHGSDMFSMLIAGEIEGRPITNEEAVDVATLLMLGGLDTVASMLGFVTRALAMNPEQRRLLIGAKPAFLQSAIEELIRRHGLSNTQRTIAKDFEYDGVFFKKGDTVQQVGSLYGLDDDQVSDPMKLDFTRKQIPHAAFGAGVHMCPGQFLARREIKVFLEEWLARIPDFDIKPGSRPQMGFGVLSSMKKLDLVWTP